MTSMNYRLLLMAHCTEYQLLLIRSFTSTAILAFIDVVKTLVEQNIIGAWGHEFGFLDDVF